MYAYTIILSLDTRRTRRFIELLTLLGAGTTRYVEIEKVMPRSTFRQLFYQLKIVRQYVADKYGFEIFAGRWVVGSHGRRVKVIEPLVDIAVEHVEGMSFVALTKVINGVDEK